MSPGTGDVSREACLAALFAVGAQGVHEDGTSLVTHFPPQTNLEAVHFALTEADESVTIETALVPDIDWSEAWKSRLNAHDLGSLTVTPPWLAEGRDPARTIVIEPGMAFGTGEHATTRGVVRLLPTVMRDGDIVADLGAGSAVLAIAAAKLGASRVYAVELDAEAIPNAEENVRRNGVADRVHVFEADAGVLLPLLAPVRVVLANIISSVLVELLPIIADALSADGGAILSGILQEEREQLLAVLAATGWRVLDEDAEDIWWSVSIARA
ncbi:50S ribosomal protein L11 methyltransferase [Gemmatimonas sp.]|uniref:50S ribosomal protein L11 methyltransferase n=1 Tax=Gemmatimonas sp. TaxID=1962908 RepID=UPI0039834605